jgi:hypothetical protein
MVCPVVRSKHLHRNPLLFLNRGNSSQARLRLQHVFFIVFRKCYYGDYDCHVAEPSEQWLNECPTLKSALVMHINSEDER